MANGKYQYYLTEEGLLKLEGWARDGLTDEQIAEEKIGINRTTLYAWKNKYPDISDALKQGKEVIDRKVENALLKRALGYEYNEDEYAVYEMEDTAYFDALDKHMHMFRLDNPEATDDELLAEKMNFEKIKVQLIKRKTKEVAPDVNAAKFWLMNRKPEEWRDKQFVQHDGTVNVNNPFVGLSEDELRRLANDDSG